MDSVFLSSAMPFMAAPNDRAPLEPKKAKTEMRSEKIAQFEQKLRRETIQSVEQVTSQRAGNSAFATREQGELINAFAPQNTSYNTYANKLGDYSRLLGEMGNIKNGAVDAMSLSTLISKKPITRVEDNNTLAMLTNQFGLNSQADRLAKKAKKNPRMSAGTFMWKWNKFVKKQIETDRNISKHIETNM